MSELRECPFCGGEAKSWHTIDDFWCSGRAGCGNDGCYVHPVARGTDEDAAIRIWNSRAERTCEPVKKFSDESPWPRLVCSECGRGLHWDDIVNEVGEESAELQPYCGCGARVVESW